MPENDSAQVTFRKSTHSDTHGCVEVAALGRQRLVRDSKNPDGPTLAFTASVWSAFLGRLKKVGRSTGQ